MHQAKKAEAEEAKAQKTARARVRPQDMFKDKRNPDGEPMYRDFDEDGVPTSNSSGEPVSVVFNACSRSSSPITILCSL